MGDWRAARERRAAEFESFVAGAGGRLLRLAALLTTEPVDARSGSTARPPEAPPAAQELLTWALARTYAAWDDLCPEDPYDRARQELAARFARTTRRHRRSRGGPLGHLCPLERLVLVLRLHEGLPETQTAAALGLSEERVRAVYDRALELTHQRGRRPAEAPG